MCKHLCGCAPVEGRGWRLVSSSYSLCVFMAGSLTEPEATIYRL